jgi:hypothetical protein
MRDVLSGLVLTADLLSAASAPQPRDGGTRHVATHNAICKTGRPSMGIRLTTWTFDHREVARPVRTKCEHWPWKKH